MPFTQVHVPYLALRAMSRMLCHMTAVQGEPRPSNLEQGWTVDDGTFGARLALVRQRMQWNIKEAARECGVPAASWGSWEAGSLPRRYTEICAQIAERTGASYMWLLTGPKNRPDLAKAMAPYLPLPVWTTDRGRSPNNRPSGPTGTTRPGSGRRTARVPRGRRPSGD